MKALLRPLFVAGLSIAIAGPGLFGAGAALAAANAAPATVAVGVSPTVIVEGDTVTLTVALDAPVTEQVGVTVDWGDFSSQSLVFLSPGQSLVNPPFAHTYVNNFPTGMAQSQLTIAVTVSGATTSLSASASVLVKNAPPTFTSLVVSPSAITTGQGVTLSGVFADVGKADRHFVTVNWGDGVTTVFPRLISKTYNFSYAHTYLVGGNLTVTARVTDDANEWVEASAPLTVVSTNEPPSNLVLAMSAVAEGGSSTLTASFTDPDAGDTHTATVDWGDGSPVETLPTIAAGLTAFAPAHTYHNTGPNTVTVVLNDSAGHSINGTTSVTVSNVAPSVTLDPVSSPIAGDVFALSGKFTDPGTTDTFTLSVDWGDGTAKGTPALGADGRSFTDSHTFLLEGPHPLTVTVTDRDGAPGQASATVVVRHRNVPPTNLTLSAPSVVQGVNTIVSGAFSDADSSDTHTVVMSWGDGAPSVTWSLPAGATTFTATHGYATAGTWTVTATVTDPADASASATTQAVVTVPATTTAALLDQMSGLVQSFGLDRTTERWLVRRIDQLKTSLSSGTHELCDALADLDRFWWVAGRTLTSEQLAALRDLVTKIQVSAHCPADQTGEHGSVTNPPTVTAPTAPKQAAPKHDGDKNDQNNSDPKNDHDKNDGAKSDKGNQTNSGRANSAKGVHHSRADN